MQEEPERTVTMTVAQAKLCLDALLVYPCEHRSPHAGFVPKLVEMIEPSTTFRGDPRHIIPEQHAPGEVE